MNYLFWMFTILAYVVTVHDIYQIIAKSYHYGRLRRLRDFRTRIAMKLIPSLARDMFENFTDYDIDIQLKKLRSRAEEEQLGGLLHIEQILKFIVIDQPNSHNGKSTGKIRWAIYRLLGCPDTTVAVAQKALDMLCENEHLHPKNA